MGRVEEESERRQEQQTFSGSRDPKGGKRGKDKPTDAGMLWAATRLLSVWNWQAAWEMGARSMGIVRRNR
jgi:hypothetical protein